MMSFISSFMLAISFLPASLQALILGFIAILAIILIFKLVAMVLDAIPFV